MVSPDSPDLAQCSALRLAGLWVYPVKSCAGIALDEARVDATGGLEGDREWVVLDAKGAVTWQGAYPRLALVQPGHDNGVLTLGAPAMPLFRVDGLREARSLRLWNEQRADFDEFAGEDAGDAASEWLSTAAGLSGTERLRLVRLGRQARTRPGLNPLHVVGAASLALLNERLERQGASAVEVERFRPNLLIEEAVPEALDPFDEQRMVALHLELGSHVLARLDFHAECVRCVMPNIDLYTAAVGTEPLASVAQLSTEREAGSPARLGAYGRLPPGTELRRGMAAWGELRF